MGWCASTRCWSIELGASYLRLTRQCTGAHRARPVPTHPVHPAPGRWRRVKESGRGRQASGAAGRVAPGRWRRVNESGGERQASGAAGRVAPGRWRRVNESGRGLPRAGSLRVGRSAPGPNHSAGAKSRPVDPALGRRRAGPAPSGLSPDVPDRPRSESFSRRQVPASVDPARGRIPVRSGRVADSAEAGRLPGQRATGRLRARAHGDGLGPVQRKESQPRRRRRHDGWPPRAPADERRRARRCSALPPSSLAPPWAGWPSRPYYRLPAGERRIAEVATSATENRRDPRREAGVLLFVRKDEAERTRATKGLTR